MTIKKLIPDFKISVLVGDNVYLKRSIVTSGVLHFLLFAAVILWVKILLLLTAPGRLLTAPIWVSLRHQKYHKKLTTDSKFSVPA